MALLLRPDGGRRAGRGYDPSSNLCELTVKARFASRSPQAVIMAEIPYWQTGYCFPNKGLVSYSEAVFAISATVAVLPLTLISTTPTFVSGGLPA